MEIAHASLIEQIQEEYHNSGGNLSLTIEEFADYFQFEAHLTEKLIEELISTGHYQIINSFDFFLGKDCDRVQIHPLYQQNYWLFSLLVPNEAKALLELGFLLKHPFNSRIKNLEIKDQHLIRLTLLGHDICSFSPMIEAFHHLEVLEIQRCQLTSIPDSIGSLPKLKILDLDHNHLQSLPKTLGNLKNLQELWCRHNKLITIPRTLGNLTNLQELSLAYNRLVSIPDSLGALNNLRIFSVKNNYLTTLPPVLCDLPNLNILELSGNQFTSSPVELKNRQNLQVVNYPRSHSTSSSSSDNEYLLKICAISSASTLKTEFIRSFAENKFDRNDLPTLGVDITTKKINVGSSQVKLILVDTAGQEFFGKLRPSYYRGASAAVILFDKSDPKSFDAVPNWLQEFQTFVQPEVPMALVGFIPHSEETPEVISFEEGNTLATELNMTYFESKPSDSQQACKIFSSLAKQVIKSK
ncbi:MAG: leucine-rich repeat domain-containing protein [Candidatus Hodarchaeales archaeon]